MSLTPRLWVVKIGGSIDEEPGALARLLSVLTELSARERMLIVPGGGAFADFVRTRYSAHHTPEETAHIQAVLSMAQFGYQIAGLSKNIQPVHDKTESAEASQKGFLPVFIPYPWILGAKDIPPSWSVTSDTIAVRVCEYIGASRLVLLKSVNGVIGPSGAVVAKVDTGAPPKTDVVDRSFFESLKPGWETWIINGRKPERLKKLVETGATTGTKVFS